MVKKSQSAKWMGKSKICGSPPSSSKVDSLEFLPEFHHTDQPESLSSWQKASFRSLACLLTRTCFLNLLSCHSSSCDALTYLPTNHPTSRSTNIPTKNQQSSRPIIFSTVFWIMTFLLQLNTTVPKISNRGPQEHSSGFFMCTADRTKDKTITVLGQPKRLYILKRQVFSWEPALETLNSQADVQKKA